MFEEIETVSCLTIKAANIANVSLVFFKRNFLIPETQNFIHVH